MTVVEKARRGSAASYDSPELLPDGDPRKPKSSRFVPPWSDPKDQIHWGDKRKSNNAKAR